MSCIPGDFTVFSLSKTMYSFLTENFGGGGGQKKITCWRVFARGPPVAEPLHYSIMSLATLFNSPPVLDDTLSPQVSHTVYNVDEKNSGFSMRRELVSTQPRSSWVWSIFTSTGSSTGIWNQRMCCWMMQVGTHCAPHKHYKYAQGTTVGATFSPSFLPGPKGSIKLYSISLLYSRWRRHFCCLELFSSPLALLLRTCASVWFGSCCWASAWKRQNQRICRHTRYVANIRPWSKGVSYRGNRVPFQMQPMFTLICGSPQASWLRSWLSIKSKTTLRAILPWGGGVTLYEMIQAKGPFRTRGENVIMELLGCEPQSPAWEHNGLTNRPPEELLVSQATFRKQMSNTNI